MVAELQQKDQMAMQADQMAYQQQMQRNQEAMQRGMEQEMARMDMGGMQNIPVGVEQSNPNLQAIQNQAMLNNMPQGTEPQVPEGIASAANIPGGMPPEMMGMIPQGM